MATYGFPPVASTRAKALILGSLPSRKSVERSEYYANPQNSFWKIMTAAFPKLPTDYANKAAYLTQHGIALWDVLAAANRSGSLDADITDPIPNNLRAFLHMQPEIRWIYFNGTLASNLYRDHVLPGLDEQQRMIDCTALPSSSSAHARLSLSQKVERWSVVWKRLANPS